MSPSDSDGESGVNQGAKGLRYLFHTSGTEGLFERNGEQGRDVACR